MALNVNTNVASLSVQKKLNQSSDALGLSMSRLASGLRINSAKDDAAGLQIANRLTTQIRGMTMAVQNAGNAISIVQTAEGALQESTNILQRMRELSLQSKNGSNSQSERNSLNAEFVQLTEELTRVSRSTNFGSGLKLLDGSAGAMTFHVGANTGDSEEITLTLATDFSSESLFAATEAKAGVPGDTISSGSKAVVAGEYSSLTIDGSGNRNVIPVDALLVQAQTDAETARDTARVDLATAPADDVKQKAFADAQTAVESAKKAVADDASKNKPFNDEARGDNIDATVLAIDKALETINAARADLGAKQNRLSSTVANLNNIIENASVSRGRIQDVDFASETAELTKQQTLQQASTAILAQANQLPAAVLKLLQ